MCWTMSLKMLSWHMQGRNLRWEILWIQLLKMSIRAWRSRFLRLWKMMNCSVSTAMTTIQAFVSDYSPQKILLPLTVLLFLRTDWFQKFHLMRIWPQNLMYRYLLAGIMFRKLQPMNTMFLTVKSILWISNIWVRTSGLWILTADNS